MSAYTEFFLKSKRSQVQLQLMRIEHPSFSKPYNLVRNSATPVDLIIDGNYYKFTYAPMQIKQIVLNDDLDTGFEVQLGDLGEILGTEIGRLNTTQSYNIKPSVTYYEYDSADLSAPLYGPINLEIKNFSYTREGSAFVANAPQLNNNRTGEIYTFERFPSLKGFATYSTYYSEPSYLEFVSGGIIDLISGEKIELES